MYTVYILQNQTTQRHYIGHTKDLKHRLNRHNTGRNVSTKSSGKWAVVYRETFSDKKNAWTRETQIKKYKGGEAFKKLLQ
ncbi:MAG: hypothetical protein A2898_03945 [Candidatus Kerfeldbacteria bacterium RIFCSPLOWO2_01_FULL_48_11]|uniref:GIY-YIG domain-containing protein n=1 Tax=Candidatus Kerfeldbacteria bacterium RIFCSPLOWO2_01_FULL_48_11 TaxID=1798543 RepID=A0A1G2B810_9BACT|nr:MAG: hypothetical protein A2898_03945 [Candidatus Kerfeldbacteria bacterium RIFCSPLOWO2_01_FULL_48_11]HCM67788.1 endonuclease [Candidatus Kerfeldbacteria bacterium]